MKYSKEKILCSDRKKEIKQALNFYSQALRIELALARGKSRLTNVNINNVLSLRDELKINSDLGKFDDFYVLTATENFTTTGGIDTVKAWVSYSENVSPNTINCDRSNLAYGFNPKFITDEAIIPLTNYSKLYKYDGMDVISLLLKYNDRKFVS